MKNSTINPFCLTTKPYDPEEGCSLNGDAKFNPQTTKFCRTWDIDDPVRVAQKWPSVKLQHNLISVNILSFH